MFEGTPEINVGQMNREFVIGNLINILQLVHDTERRVLLGSP